VPILSGSDFGCEVSMCLICIEYNKNKMTKEEVKKALPEMISFSKNEKEKKHLENLLKFEDLEFANEIENYIKDRK
jgi:hypothetical protein